jgi:iron complex transport system ATP-binding protein
MTMHDVNMALRYSNRFIFLKEGKIYSYCKKNDITASIIEEVYGIPVVIEQYDSIPVVIPKGGK